MWVSQRSPLAVLLISFLFQCLSIWINSVQAKSSDEKNKTMFMQGCDYQYLQKAAPSPQCLRGTEPLVQGCWNLLAASFQSWTREAWGPEGASSWPDLRSSNTHNETLIGDKRQTRKIKQCLKNESPAQMNSGVSVLTKIFKLFFQGHAVVWETLLADQSVSAAGVDRCTDGKMSFMGLQLPDVFTEFYFLP